MSDQKGSSLKPEVYASDDEVTNKQDDLIVCEELPKKTEVTSVQTKTSDVQSTHIVKKTSESDVDGSNSGISAPITLPSDFQTSDAYSKPVEKEIDFQGSRCELNVESASVASPTEAEASDTEGTPVKKETSFQDSYREADIESAPIVSATDVETSVAQTNPIEMKTESFEGNYREPVVENSDSDDTSTSDEEFDWEDRPPVSPKKNTVFVRDELGLDDLPPVEDLNISVDENKCKELGSILNVVDNLVVVQSNEFTPPLDFDSVLFLEGGKRSLGKIFEVFGPINRPLYCVRFNTKAEIKSKGISPGLAVYCAPQTEYTAYVQTSELMKYKGSDASWKDNVEPPAELLDFSDDEEEAKIKKKKRELGRRRREELDDVSVIDPNETLTAKRGRENPQRFHRGLVRAPQFMNHAPSMSNTPFINRASSVNNIPFMNRVPFRNNAPLMNRAPMRPNTLYTPSERMVPRTTLYNMIFDPEFEGRNVNYASNNRLPPFADKWSRR